MFIITFVQAQSYKGYKKQETGYYSQFYKQNKNGVKPKVGDIVKLVLSYSNSKDSLLFDSRANNPNNNAFIEFELLEAAFKGGFEDALQTMAAGDSASFLVNADSIYLKTFMLDEVPFFIEKGSMLKFQVKLEKVTTKEQFEKEKQEKADQLKNEEPKAIANYLAVSKINVGPTASGLYYVEKSKGTGDKASKGSLIKVNYTGRFIDGTLFDTSNEASAKEAGLFDERRTYEPIEFTLGTGQVIPGWDEGIALMNVGTKAQLVIPSNLGYGENANGPIPAYSPLIFDVELISFTPAE